ncbi:MAG: antitoxin [Oscillospiraceae bacterium]|nr:antitoxin [Oscillospiraceae bacterium]
MADILRISTPLVDKNPIHMNRPVADPSVPFQLSDITKVIKPGQQNEILQQNNGFINKDESPTILMNLLKDPSVTVGFLKNITMLQEIIKLLPANNTALTQEIEQLFRELMINPEDITSELLNQELSSTSFKGDLFDFLRTLLAQNPKTEMRYAIANFLKSLNSLATRQNITRSISNSLSFLSNSLSASGALSQKLSALSQQFAQRDAAENFAQLKDDTLAVLKEIEGSILYSPKIQKILPLVVYNLSRFNDNPDFLQEALGALITATDGDEQKQQLVNLLREYITAGAGDKKSSQVMDVLAKIIGRETEDTELSLLGGDKVERIIHSLLSSPCNFTPLLHFIIPMQQNDLKAFAEMWIDPNAQSEDSKGNVVKDCIHMLIVFDVEGIGRFEAELAVTQKNMMLNLMCPPAYVSAFEGMGSALRTQIENTGYKLVNVSVEKLERQRSLMDVFKMLPYRRTGVDVKV